MMMSKIAGSCFLAVISLILAGCCAENTQQAAPQAAATPVANRDRRRPRVPDPFRVPMALNCSDAGGWHDVYDWQNFLYHNTLLNMPIPSEQYGNATKSGTMAFQQKAGVQTTTPGTVDANTYKAALTYAVNHYPLMNTTLSGTSCVPPQ